MTATPPAAREIEVEVPPAGEPPFGPLPPLGEPVAALVGEVETHEFDAFVLEWGPRLGRFAFLLTGDHQLAEDLVQTALAKVVRQWGRVVERGDPAPYVRTVVLQHGDRLAPPPLAGRAPDRAGPGRPAGRRHGRPRRPGAPAAGAARAPHPPAGGGGAAVLRGPRRGRGRPVARVLGRHGEEPDGQGPREVAFDPRRRSPRIPRSTLMDDTDRPLSVALAELARTMPDDPRRLSKVRERARRARRRRTVAQGSVVTATVGSLALGLVASGPGSGGDTTTATAAPAAARPSPPPRRRRADRARHRAARRPGDRCRPAPTSSRSRPPRLEAADSIDEADAKKAAQAAADGQAPDEPAAADAADAKRCGRRRQGRAGRGAPRSLRRWASEGRSRALRSCRGRPTGRR